MEVRQTVNTSEKQYIHTLFVDKNYLELYQIQSKTLHEMLFVNTQQEFEDFLKSEDSLEEDIFWLYYAVVQAESLLIGAYEEDVTSKVSMFLKEKLPTAVFTGIQIYLQDIYVDIDDRDNLQEKMDTCNQYLSDKNYFIQVEYEDTYCALAYFLTVKSK